VNVSQLKLRSEKFDDDDDDDEMMTMMIKNRTKICNTMKTLPLILLFLYATHLKQIV
jgi:hypothetical protein